MFHAEKSVKDLELGEGFEAGPVLDWHIDGHSWS